MAHVTVRLQVSDYNLTDQLEQNTAVYSAITFKEFVIQLFLVKKPSRKELKSITGDMFLVPLQSLGCYRTPVIGQLHEPIILGPLH